MTAENTVGTALITGASAGIGAAYADRLARRGYDLILVARDQHRLDATAARIGRATRVRLELLAADLTDAASLHGVERRLRQDSTITMLVNNAGMSVSGGLIEADIDRQQAMIELNVVAPTRLSAAAASAFAARRHGTIVNMSSALALAPEIFNGVYSGSKAYLLNLTLSMHEELSPRGIRVQAVLPGAIRTEFWGRAGIDVAGLPESMVMEVDELVDAALQGLDRGELVTIPSLPDSQEWDRLNSARIALRPNLSHDHAAERYRIVA